MKRPSVVLAFGTFDLLHRGHWSFLRQAKKRGSVLVVGVGRDRNVRTLKGHRPVQDERTRCHAVAALPFVDKALLAPADPSRRFAFIGRISPDIIALGYDQTHYTQHLEKDLRKRGVSAQIVRLKPYLPRRYKSSIIRRTLVPLEANKRKRR